MTNDKMTISEMRDHIIEHDGGCSKILCHNCPAHFTCHYGILLRRWGILLDHEYVIANKLREFVVKCLKIRRDDEL